MGLSFREIATDRVDDAGGLLAAFDFDSDADHRLNRAFDFFDADNLANTADPGADLDGSDEAQPVGADVDRMCEAPHLDQIRQEEIDQAHGQIAMSDRAAERAVLGALWVDMDPLVIAGHFGKAVDPVLFNGESIGRTKQCPFLANQIARAFVNLGHGHALWLDTDSTSPVM